MNLKLALTLISTIILSACASKGPNQNLATTQAGLPEAPATRVVDSIDGSYTGNIIGTIGPGSKFAKLKIGMEMPEVHALIKAPDDMQRFETGKRWIPFYFGNDAQRVQVYYKGEGCLTYTGGGPFGGGGGDLIEIYSDKTKTCFE